MDMKTLSDIHSNLGYITELINYSYEIFFEEIKGKINAEGEMPTDARSMAAYRALRKHLWEAVEPIVLKSDLNRCDNEKDIQKFFEALFKEANTKNNKKMNQQAIEVAKSQNANIENENSDIIYTSGQEIKPESTLPAEKQQQVKDFKNWYNEMFDSLEIGGEYTSTNKNGQNGMGR